MTAVLYASAAVLIALAALVAVVRLVRGPTILDRMIASDMLLTLLLLAVGAEMVINSHLRTVPLMIVISVAAGIATISVARFVAQQSNGGEDADAHANGEKENA